jgi:hypothetical protein
MSVESSRITYIRDRWTRDRRISAKDVEWLLGQADTAETFRAAQGLHDRSRPASMFDDIFKGMGL